MTPQYSELYRARISRNTLGRGGSSPHLWARARGGSLPVVGAAGWERAQRGGVAGGARRLCLSLFMAQFEFGARLVRFVFSLPLRVRAWKSDRLIASPVRPRVHVSVAAASRLSRDRSACSSVRPPVRHTESRSPGRIWRNGSRRTSRSRARTHTHRRFRSAEMRRKTAMPTAAGSSIAPRISVSWGGGAGSCPWTRNRRKWGEWKPIDIFRLRRCSPFRYAVRFGKGVTWSASICRRGSAVGSGEASAIVSRRARCSSFRTLARDYWSSHDPGSPEPVFVHGAVIFWSTAVPFGANLPSAGGDSPAFKNFNGGVAKKISRAPRLTSPRWTATVARQRVRKIPRRSVIFNCLVD